MTIYPECFKQIHLDECASTNDYIKENLARLEVDFPLLISAGAQTAGRGREDRGWSSPPDLGIYATFGFVLPDRRALSLLSIACGVALIDMLAGWTGKAFVLKWPNDVLADGKKIAGILCETIIKADKVICLAGIGVNVNHECGDFPGELRDRAGSLKQLSGTEWALPEGRDRLAASMASWLQKLANDDRTAIVDRARELSRPFLGRPLSFHHQGLHTQGILLGIAADGGLRLQLPGGEIKTFYSGEFQTECVE